MLYKYQLAMTYNYSTSHKIQKINLSKATVYTKTTVLDKLHSFGDTKYVNHAQIWYLYYLRALGTRALDSINTYWTWFM